jgi:CHAT domain-containing protein
VIGEAIDHLVELHAPGSSKRLDIARRRARLAEELRWCVPDVFSDSAWQAVTRRAQDLPAYLDAFLSEAAQASKHEDALYELERFRSQSLVNVISERSYLWRGGEDSRLTFKGRFTNENQRAQYRFAALVAMGASWQARREAAERADELDSNALTAGGIITLDVGERGLHFPQTLAEHLHEVTLANDEALVFQRTLKDRTLLWLMRHDGTIVHRALTDFTREDVSHLSAQLWSPRKGKSTDRSMSREVGEFGLVEQPVGSVEKVISQLDRRLATPLAQALQENSVKTAFFVPGTDVTNLPLDHCRTWQAANIAVSFLPTARALGFARTPRYPRSERLYLVTEQDRRRYAKDVLGKEERSVLLVIDPTGSLQYAPLEAAVVALESRQGSFDILSGAEADEQTVSQKASHVGVLHLISHGIFDDASPYRSGMFMKPGKAADALWMVAEVFSDVSAPAGRLVVLSGCETGRTQPNLVSEEVSLPAAFLAAGFAAVVASRWAVDDLSTSLLIGEFYRHWSGGGISVSTALRHASEWLRTLDKSTTLTHLQGLTERLPQLHSPLGKRAREIVQDAMVAIDKADDEPFRDPKHWAAFYVVGDGAITADSFPSQKLSLPTRKRRAARG